MSNKSYAEDDVTSKASPGKWPRAVDDRVGPSWHLAAPKRPLQSPDLAETKAILDKWLGPSRTPADTSILFDLPLAFVDEKEVGDLGESMGPPQHSAGPSDLNLLLVEQSRSLAVHDEVKPVLVARLGASRYSMVPLLHSDEAVLSEDDEAGWSELLDKCIGRPRLSAEPSFAFNILLLHSDEAVLSGDDEAGWSELLDKCIGRPRLSAEPSFAFNIPLLHSDEAVLSEDDEAGWFELLDKWIGRPKLSAEPSFAFNIPLLHSDEAVLSEDDEAGWFELLDKWIGGPKLSAEPSFAFNIPLPHSDEAVLPEDDEAGRSELLDKWMGLPQLPAELRMLNVDDKVVPPDTIVPLRAAASSVPSSYVCSLPEVGDERAVSKSVFDERFVSPSSSTERSICDESLETPQSSSDLPISFGVSSDIAEEVNPGAANDTFDMTVLSRLREANHQHVELSKNVLALWLDPH